MLDITNSNTSHSMALRGKTRKASKSVAYAAANTSKREQRKAKRQNAEASNLTPAKNPAFRAAGHVDNVKALSNKAAHRARAADRLNKYAN